MLALTGYGYAHAMALAGARDGHVRDGVDAFLSKWSRVHHVDRFTGGQDIGVGLEKSESSRIFPVLWP